jgi:hypothetical protein
MADDPLDPRLHHRPGIPAEIWVEPSPQQWFWARALPRYFAPRPDEERGLSAWFARATVVPSTNLTYLSLQYQSYLNDIFHLRRVSRVVHFVCMPIITALVLAALHPLRVGGVPGSLLGAIALAGWWLLWAVRERLLLWGAVSVAWAGGIYAGATWLASSPTIAPASSPSLTPLLWALALAFVQAASHAPEPRLPPRVTRSPHWIATTDYLLGHGDARRTWGARVVRLLHLIEISFYGPIDEFIASPRLAPIQLLEILWLVGYAPRTRAAWKSLSARAVASGNPAIDYIGTGGGTTLRPTPPPTSRDAVS